MPFVSDAQRRYLYSQHPEIAKEFAKHTSKAQMKKLPEHVKSKKGEKHGTKERY
ncbi:MAG TPA: hypothetical protein VNX68_12955 [Nitrosopumilaceae archaeon]|jgi:hypothetical protein|nr:hypothetical protein [Nitrosopumilaceae archaeon]